MAEEKPREPCHVCGNEYSAPYLYHHLRTKHGVYGGATSTKRRFNGRADRNDNLTRAVKETALVPVAAVVETPEWEELGKGYVLLRRKNGKFFVAQEIRFGDA